MLRPRATLPSIVLVALTAGAWLVSGRPAAAALNLDPFAVRAGTATRRAPGSDTHGAALASPAHPGAILALDPVKPDDAGPSAGAASAPPASAPPASAPPAAAPATAPPASAPPASVAAPVSCQEDADCPDENICEQARCQRIQQHVNVFYLYYKEGTFREILGLYWSKRGPTGYNVLAPFYWSYFAPTSHSRVVAPFYWHFADDAAHRTSTVIVPGLPVSWSRQPGASSFGVWPLFYASTKFGWAAPR